MCSAENEAFLCELELMTTVGCHLCDQAVALMQQVLDGQRFAVDLVDIAYDDQLMAKYAEHIPVLLCPHTGDELAWPFDARQLSDFAVRVLAAGVAPGQH